MHEVEDLSCIAREDVIGHLIFSQAPRRVLVCIAHEDIDGYSTFIHSLSHFLSPKRVYDYILD